MSNRFILPSLKHFQIREPEIKYDLLSDSHTAQLIKSIVAKVVDHQDKALCDAIVEYAYKNGYTDLILIDEEFVKSAIIHERIRRGVSDPKRPMEVSDNGMERWVCDCGNLMYKKQKYCDECGQKFNWED